jgi:hypothetical protein
MTHAKRSSAPRLSLPIPETAVSVPGRSHFPEENCDGFIRPRA